MAASSSSSIMAAPSARVTKDTVTIKSISEFMADVDKDMHLARHRDAEIWFYSGCDKENKMTERLEYEWSMCPLTNKALGDDAPCKADEKRRFIAIYVVKFFSDNQDFCFLVKGTESMNKFLGMTFSGRAYEDPCFATPLHMLGQDSLFKTRGLQRTHYERVGKNETKGMRWMFLYGSAVKAWKQLEFSQDKYESIDKTLGELKIVATKDDDSDSTDGWWDSDSDDDDDE